MLFYCPSCVSDKHTHELAELKSAVVALVLEVEQLKSSVHMLSSIVQSAEGDERMWSQVVQKKRKPRELTRVWRNRLGNGPASVTNAVGTLMIEQAPSSQKEKVVGARRIWGTTKTTTVATVTSALTSVGDKLVI